MKPILLLLSFVFFKEVVAQKLPVLKPEVYDQKQLNKAERDSIQARAQVYKSILEKQAADKKLTEEEDAFLSEIEGSYEEASLDSYLTLGAYYYIGSWGCNYYENGGPDSTWASSTLGKNFDVENLGDEILDRAWAEGKPGSGIGETINYRTIRNAWPLEKIIIYNGYQKEIGLWKRNNRVKELKLYVDGKAVAVLPLADETGAQSFDVTKWFKQREKPYAIKLEILSVYKGDKHDDTVISEIAFDGEAMH